MYYLHTSKQRKYFDEVIRLHYEKGYGKGQIARLLPVGHTTVDRWIREYSKSKGEISTVNSGERKADLFKRVEALYEAGTTPTAMSRITGMSRTTIYKWIAIFAKGKDRKAMTKEKETICQQQSGAAAETELSTEELIAKLKATEEALRKAELRADLYSEIINVAEAKFKISIRKKAGAKQ